MACARALAAIVQNHIHTSSHEVGVKRVGGGFDIGAAVGADGANHHGEGRQGVGPNDAFGIVVLLDGGGRQAGDANAVATHLEVLGLAVIGQKRGAHGLAVLGAEVKNMTHLDAALDGQHAFAIGRDVAFDHVADVGNHVGLGQVAAPIGASHVKVNRVGTTHPIGHHSHFAVDDDF